MSDLDNEQIAIIEHTIKNGLFCGESKEMDDLCDKGLMECVGKKSFVPDKYYKVTNEGKAALKTMESE